MSKNADTDANDENEQWTYPEEPAPEDDLRDPRVVKAIDFMNANLHRRIVSAELAEAVHLSYSRLSELFNAETGVPPMEYLRQLRMERAMHLVTRTRLNMKEIRARVGYNTRGVFIDSFKKSFRRPPSEYRKIVLTERASKSRSQDRS